MSSNERTPLTNPGPSRSTYIFPGVSPRSRRRQMRSFQCCMCAIFLGVLAIALVITISYAIMENPATNETSFSDNEIFSNPEDGMLLNGTEGLIFLMNIEHPLEDEIPPTWALPQPLIKKQSEAEAEAQNYGLRKLGDREMLEENIALIPPNTPSFRHQRAVSTSAEGRKLAKRGYVEYQATLFLAKMNNYTKPAGRHNVGDGPNLKLSDVQKHVECNFNSRYRTANGTCNNKRHPIRFGCALTPFRRALQPDYADGISAPRKGLSGNELPSAREVSTQIHRPSYATDSNFSVMLAVWGQFLDHDITATALSTGQDGDPIDCCAISKLFHPECFPVPIGRGDPFYDDYNITCINFVRSAAAPTGKFGPREQLNQATSFIDGSVVYGNTEQRHDVLRSKVGGQLRMFVTADNRTLLPLSTDPNDGCNQKKMNDKGKYCFDSGDQRANENLYLTSMHLLLARQHNYLAHNIEQKNPQWSDEKIFQEARKILGAQMQHITYNEFLPILLGEELAASKGLLPNSTNNKDTYNATVNPSIANHFAAAVFRFAHTLLPSLMKMGTDDNNFDNIQLHKMLFNPFSLWTWGGLDKAMGSAATTPTLEVNQFFTVEVTEKLFEETPVVSESKKQICGLDLVSLNIQRGRDHGIPSYSEWRKHCGLPSVDTWVAMAGAVDADSLENMRRIYENPRDVDVYTGALSELPIEGAIFGPLLACLVTDQFMRIKFGDSFWYERKVGPQRFSRGQLAEIYKTTLGGIICTNSDGVKVVQRNVMLRPNNDTNPYISCNEIPQLDFNYWTGKKMINTMGRVKTSVANVLIANIQSNTTQKENSGRL